MPEQIKKPEIIVFAGPNGSGKSTVTTLAKTISPYVNADDIKRTNSCSDLEAAQIAERLRNQFVESKTSFTFETVLSTRRNLELLMKAKKMGYFIRCIYVLTSNPDVNVCHIYDNTDIPIRIFKKRKEENFYWESEYWSKEQIAELVKFSFED